MTIDFTNKKVLITGGTKGIGKKLAQEYLRANAKVVITGTNDVFSGYSHKNLKYEQLYISSDNNWKEEINEIIEKYDGFDICVNNAGINKVNKIYETNYEDIESVILTNLNAPIYISSLVSKKMIEKKYGYIINIGSIFGVVSKEGRNPYTATKAGIIGVTKTMAIDLGEHNILVNCVSPGFVDTELTRRVLKEEGMKEMAQKVPMKKLALVSDIAPTVLFLSSDLNTYITGQNIIIDGGFTLE